MNDKAIEILSRTCDGEDLSPRDLFLVQCSINSPTPPVDDSLETAFDELYQKVVEGSYDKMSCYLYGIEHITRDHQGYVYWKGQRVEHYSYDDVEAEKAAAQQLAEHCQKLESRGFPVNWRTSLDYRLIDLDASNPWVSTLLRFYSLMRKDDSQLAVITYGDTKATRDDAVIVVSDGKTKTVRVMPHEEYESGVYLAFHALQREGFRSESAYHMSYPMLIQTMEESGMVPEDFRQALKEE